MSQIRKVHVEVKKDHLDKISSGKPVPSLAELIWNALDADATDVDIIFQNGLLGVDELIIKDNGVGIHSNRINELFGSLGGSWKKDALHSETKNRFLHGQEGKGRFKAFSLGRIVEWNIYYKVNKEIYYYSVTGRANMPDYFDISEPVKSDSKSTGVTVRITELHKQFKLLNDDYAIQKLTPIFAIYLTQYIDCNIKVDGQKIDPCNYIKNRESIKLDDVEYEGHTYEYSLEIIEWNIVSEKEFHLCNSHGFPLEKYEFQIRGVGDNSFSAYLKSEHVSILNQKALLSLADLEPSLRPVIEIAKKEIKKYFINKKIESSKEVVEEWIKENIYPFPIESMSQVDEVERRIFDIVAINVVENIPEFEKNDKKSKAFQLRLLKQALENSPEELQIILNEVLQLPKEKQAELADLLQETTLVSIIGASKLVTDRLRFLAGIDSLIFNPETKINLKERSQLHRILAENTWVFGDAFSLSVDDKSLTEVLIKHRSYFDDSLIIDSPVTRLDGKMGIVDLMLSRSIARNHSHEREHLIVELKAPSVKIGTKEINQIKNYAFAISADERFCNLQTKWTLWVISNDLDEFAKRERKQKAYKDGVIYQSDDSSEDITILVKTWSEVFQECRHRMEFIRAQLNINIGAEDGLKHLKEKYAKYTKGVLVEEENLTKN